MADEAVVRIVLQDSTGAGTGGTSAGSGGGTVVPPGRFHDVEARAYLQVTRRQIDSVVAFEKKQLDLLNLEAKAHLNLIQQQQAAVTNREKRERELLETEAKAALEVVKWNKEKERRERELLEIEARAYLNVVQQQKADADALIPKPSISVDPGDEARKKRQREVDKEQIDSTYQRIYGGSSGNSPSSPLDAILDTADSLRGVIGGVGGSIVGAVMDIVSAIRSAQVNLETARDTIQPWEMTRDQLESAAVGGEVGPYDLTPEEIVQYTAGPREELESKLDQVRRGMVDAVAGGTKPIAEMSDVGLDYAKERGLKHASGPVPGRSYVYKDEANLRRMQDVMNNPASTSADVGRAFGYSEADIAAFYLKNPDAATQDAAKASAAKPSGGATGGLAAAGGIGGIIAAVKEIADMVNTAVVGAVKGGIGAIGGIATGIASANADPSVPIENMGAAASAAGEKISAIVPLLGTFPIVIGETARALGGLMRAIDATADRYGEYSPAIAQAQAIAEVRQTMGDFRRAQQVGGEMAKYIMAQSDLQQKFEDIKVRLLTRMLPIITSILSILETAVAAGEGVATVVDTIATPLTALAETASGIANLMRDNRIPDVKDPTELIRFDDMFNTPGMGTGRDPGLVPRL